jgi:hypothetical protein
MQGGDGDGDVLSDNSVSVNAKTVWIAGDGRSDTAVE